MSCPRPWVVALLVLGGLGVSTPTTASALEEAAAPAAAPASVLRDAAQTSTRQIAIGGAVLRVRIEPGPLDLAADALFAWVERCAQAVAAYYGGFPVAAVDVRIRPARGGGLRGGKASPGRPPTIEIQVGEHASQRDLDDNWSMTHELVHLAFPNVPSRQHWIEEGLASYVEPIARARIGWLREADVWAEWLGNLQRGQPEEGDRGLDHTPTWGRTYWGGALFCFVADLEIRKRSAGRYELRDALRAIVMAGGRMTERWPLERALRVGDAATQTHVLSELYQQMGDEPVTVDLAAIWRELGVRRQAGKILYDERAPLSSLRRSFVLGDTAP